MMQIKVIEKKLHRLTLAYIEETMRRKINYFYVDYRYLYCCNLLVYNVYYSGTRYQAGQGFSVNRRCFPVSGPVPL